MIGVRLFDLRKDFDETQQELGTVIGVSKYSVSAYERDESEPPDKVKVEIAKHYNVSLDYLLGVTDKQKPIDDGSGYLRLPHGFPPAAREEAEEFIAYLMAKYGVAGKQP